MEIAKETVERARLGDQSAVADLYNATYNNVYQSVRMLVRNEDAALDIVQDAYIRGFQHLDQLKDPAQFNAWIKRIGMNTAKNYLKKKKPTLFSELGSGEEDDQPENNFVDERLADMPEENMDRKETTRLIGEILNELSEEQRIVITLYYYENMNAREIAEMLGTNENTVRSRLNYGKKKIEARVLEIEKRDGIKLHGLSPVGFLLRLFRAQQGFAFEAPNPTVLANVQTAASAAATAAGAGTAAGSAAGAATGTTAGTAVGGTALKAAAGVGAKTALGAGAKAAAGAAVKTVSAKLVAGIIATTVAVSGAVGGGIYLANRNDEPPAAVSSSAEASEGPEISLSEAESSEPEAEPAAERGPVTARNNPHMALVDIARLSAALQAYDGETGNPAGSGFCFLYLDDDHVPELVISREDSDRLEVYSCGDDGKVSFVSGEGSFQYEPGSGCVDFCRKDPDGETREIYGVGNRSGDDAIRWSSAELSWEEYEQKLAELPYREEDCQVYRAGGASPHYGSFAEAVKEQLGMGWPFFVTEEQFRPDGGWYLYPFGFIDFHEWGDLYFTISGSDGMADFSYDSASGTLTLDGETTGRLEGSLTPVGDGYRLTGSLAEYFGTPVLELFGGQDPMGAGTWYFTTCRTEEMICVDESGSVSFYRTLGTEKYPWNRPAFQRITDYSGAQTTQEFFSYELRDGSTMVLSLEGRNEIWSGSQLGGREVVIGKQSEYSYGQEYYLAVREPADVAGETKSVNGQAIWRP